MERAISGISWILFGLATAVLLRPILITAIAADDLINPFSQIYHAGTGIDPILSRSWDFVSKTGHFNYVGQTIGAMVLLVWSYLIGNFDFRYSAVYAWSKYLTYVFTVIVAAGYVRTLLRLARVTVSKWLTRAVVLAALAMTLQIHIPWSNDPVASYPLSGYLTAAIGLSFLWLHLNMNGTTAWTVVLGTGLLGAVAVLYYEYNLFAVLAVIPGAVYALWVTRDDTAKLRALVLRHLAAVVPAIATAGFFYLRNRAASAAYSGTAISLDGEFVGTFWRGLVSSLPASSWPFAFDWLTGPLRMDPWVMVGPVVGLGSVSVIVFLNRSRPHLRDDPRGQHPGSVLLVGLLPIVGYWMGTTFTQTATQKVQDESSRIGHVYNYYAVGSTAVVIITVVLSLFLLTDHSRRMLVALGVSTLMVLGTFQWALNWNVMVQFNGVVSGSRNLLVAVTEQPPMPERCSVLDTWKAMGWPEYYWLDMELGLNRLYEIHKGEPFCRR